MFIQTLASVLFAYALISCTSAFSLGFAEELVDTKEGISKISTVVNTWLIILVLFLCGVFQYFFLGK